MPRNQPGGVSAAYELRRVRRRRTSLLDCHRELAGPLTRSRRVRLFVENRPNLPDRLMPRLERFNLSRRPRRNCLREPNGIGSSFQQRRHVIAVTACSGARPGT
jgi:hypothetical protein